MMKTLDRSRPYGEVWGSVGLTCYEQDGKQFMLDGSPLEAPASDAPDPVLAKAARQSPPAAPPSGHVGPDPEDHPPAVVHSPDEPAMPEEGPGALTIAELRSAAEEMGIAVDRRWGEARLRQVIADHQSTATQSPASEPAALAAAEPSDADLRTMVELAGGTWTNRADATAFLIKDDE